MQDEPVDLSAQAALVQRIVRAGCAGPEYEALAIDLVDYGRRVLIAWVRDGSIYARCAQAKRPAQVSQQEREVLRHDGEEREQLADEVVVRALARFTRDALQGGGWKPDGGRALRSYFVTTCVQDFSAGFRQWKRGHKQPPTDAYGLDPTVDAMADTGAKYNWDLADDVASRLDLAEQLAKGMSEPMRRIAEGLIADKTRAQIAAELGMSVRAVEGHVYRYRQSLRRPP